VGLRRDNDEAGKIELFPNTILFSSTLPFFFQVIAQIYSKFCGFQEIGSSEAALMCGISSCGRFRMTLSLAVL
jgi:hypothetical protein